jgi:hypothetical protein
MKITPEAATSLAYDAFVYGYPVADNYRVMYETVVLANLPFNQLLGEARLYTYEDTAIVTPNNDTAYSSGWLDLRRESLVLSVPAISDGRWAPYFFDYPHSHGEGACPRRVNEGQPSPADAAPLLNHRKCAE